MTIDFVSSRSRTCLGAALLLVGCVQEDAPPQEDAVYQTVTGGTACDGVQLDAERRYLPRGWTDGVLTLPSGSLAFKVPASIPVTQGNSGLGKLKFIFSNNGGAAITCLYRGNLGNAYRFVKCRKTPWVTPDPDDNDNTDLPDGPADPTPTVGSTVSANSFRLHVNRGLLLAGPTKVSLHLDGPQVTDNNACTTDACNADGTISHTPVAIDDGDACTTDTCDPVTGPAHAPVDSAVCRGKLAFDDGDLPGLGANGRACSTCHVESTAFGLTPANVEQRFQDSGGTDPLFNPIDADDFRINGMAANDYTNLRQRGLIRVSIPLPANVKLLDCGSQIPCPASAQPTNETVADVWRQVPTVFNVANTGPDTGPGATWPRGPNTRGGYQFDGRIDTLQNQALSAIRTHAAAAVDPSQQFLDDVAAFQLTKFSAPEPTVLTALQTQGKAIFDRACGQVCHGGPGTSTPLIAPNRYIDIFTDFPRPVDTVSPPRYVFAQANQLAGNVRTYEFTLPDGFKVRKTTTDPGRALLTGYVVSAAAPVPPAVCAHPPCGAASADDFQKFDMPPVKGIAQTAPYFHNNSAATLVDVLDHYDAFFARTKITTPTSPSLSTNYPTTQVPAPTPLWDRPVKRVDEDGGAERAALLAYLQVL